MFRILNVFFLVDVNLFLNKFIVYCFREDKVMVLRNVMLNKNDNVFVGSRIVIKGGGMVLNIFRLSFGSFIGGIYFIVIMIFIYRDGVLNLW